VKLQCFFDYVEEIKSVPNPSAEKLLVISEALAQSTKAVHLSQLQSVNNIKSKHTLPSRVTEYKQWVYLLAALDQAVLSCRVAPARPSRHHYDQQNFSATNAV
jgi:hypothetical protein